MIYCPVSTVIKPYLRVQAYVVNVGHDPVEPFEQTLFPLTQPVRRVLQPYERRETAARVERGECLRGVRVATLGCGHGHCQLQ